MYNRYIHIVYPDMIRVLLFQGHNYNQYRKEKLVLYSLAMQSSANLLDERNAMIGGSSLLVSS